MNILICDDRPEEAAAVNALLGSSGYAMNTAVFTSGGAVLEHVRAGGAVDACILDIVMPEMSGIELAKSLRNSGYGGEIIFGDSINYS
jgi:CheY-like chemotaxis protein